MRDRAMVAFSAIMFIGACGLCAFSILFFLIAGNVPCVCAVRLLARILEGG